MSIVKRETFYLKLATSKDFHEMLRTDLFSVSNKQTSD